MRRSARLQRSTTAFAIAAAFAAAACSSGGPTDAGAGASRDAGTSVKDASSSQSEPAEVAWTTKLDVIGQPVDAGPAVLVLTRADSDAVELVSLDREDGHVNFRMPFHPGGAPTGVAMTPRATETDAGRHLAVLRRAGPSSSGPALVAVDVRTGEIVASTPTAVDDYEACSDGHDVCWSGFPRRAGGIVDGPFGPFRDIIRGGAPRRWDLETGRTAEKTLQEGALRVGDPDLFVVGENRLAELVRLPGTRRTEWTQSVSVLVGDGVASKYGWSFHHDDDDDVYVGALGRPMPPKQVRRYQQGKRVSMSYTTRYVTAGIDGRTGQHLWDREGADAWCQLVRSLPETGARTLCVVSGTRIDRKGEKTTYDNLTVELQGVEPRSGEVTWTFSVTGADAERAYVDRRAPLAPYGVVLPSDTGPVALDERTGELEQVADETVLLCAAGSRTVSAYGRRYSAGRLYVPCDPSGDQVDGEVSLFGASALEGTGGTRIVSMPGRVVAYSVD